MSSGRNRSTTASFPPASHGKRKDVPAPDSIDPSNSTVTTKRTQESPSKKRKLSSSTPAPNQSSTAISKPNSTTPPQPLSPTDPTPENHPLKTLQLTHHTGDIFSAPPHTLLIHACNTRGVWGAGIALAFKKRYPTAYAAHRAYCRSRTVATGTAQLIAPHDSDGHWIGCLFTSRGYGKGKDRPEEMLTNTGRAMEELLEMVRGEGVGEVRMCRVNSGRFGVEWERSEGVLRGIEVREGWRGRVGVWVPGE